MKHAIVKEHSSFFAKNHFVEFEELLTLEEAEALGTRIDASLGKRLGKMLITSTPQQLFLAGHDLWRDDPLIKKIVLSKKLAEVCATLFQVKQLRIGYDQYVGVKKIQAPFFSTPQSLQSMSSLDPLAGGLLLRLNGENQKLPAPFPEKIGNGVFIDPTLPIPFAALQEVKNENFLLISYCPLKTFYIFNKGDLLKASLKAMGYSLNEKITNATHPVVSQ